MEKLNFKQFVLILLFFIGTQVLNAQVKVVNDPKNNIIKTAIKGIQKGIQKLEKEGVVTNAKQLTTITEVLNETQKYMGMLETVSQSVKAVSDFKKILEEQSNILINYDKGLKTIVRSQYLTISQRKAYYSMYEVYFEDCKKVLSDSKALLRNKELKMLDGDRIMLLNKNFKKILKISNAAAYTNNVFIARINQIAKDTNALKEIEKWENTYYNNGGSTVTNW